jgi:hypothetical protein
MGVSHGNDEFERIKGKDQAHTDVEVELNMSVFFLLLAVVVWSSFHTKSIVRTSLVLIQLEIWQHTLAHSVASALHLSDWVLA